MRVTTGWVPGDGKTIPFWSDRWILQEPLLGWVRGQLPEGELNARIEEYWIEGVGWDMVRLGRFFLASITYRMNAVVIKGVLGLEDKVPWKGNSNGEFTVSSAYSLLRYEVVHQPCMESFFKRIWGVVTPERVRVFLWMVSHQVIITNVERVRRHIGDSEVCSVCRGAVTPVF